MLNRRLLRHAQAGRASFGLSVGFSLLGGGLTVAQAWTLSRVVERAFLGGAGLAALGPQLMILLGIMVLRGLAVAGSEVAASHVALRVKTDLRRALLRHLFALGPAHTQGERTGELTATAVEGIEALEPYFSQYLPQLVTAALVPLTILFVVGPLDWLSALVLCLTAPLIPVFMVLIGKAAEALTRRQYTLLGRLSAHFLDVVQGLTTLKVLGQSRAQARTIARISERYRLVTMEVLRVAFLSALVLEIVATLSTAIIAVEVGLRLLAGSLSFQPALFILVLAPEFYLPLRLLGQRFHAAASGASAAGHLFEILDQPVPVAMTAATSGARAPNGHAPLSGAMSFRDVQYAYEGGRRPALRGASFEIGAGQTVALVGPSGAGKSTVANLLLRFITPDRGEILASGARLSALPVDAWRQQVAWVPQAPHLFHASLADNIRLARPTATDDEVQRAAERAQLDAFVDRLPEGYATLVGEHGARLSGGEGQRLALARAFLKDAPLLILDEPTSSVDPELEAQLQAATAELMSGRTVLLIAHRLSTVYQADHIIVLCAGRVAEAGTHAALLRQGGSYARLVAAGLEPA
jgi:ATP-binding cassette subfamily C protein CydD